MFESIQQFEEVDINNLQKVEKEFISTKDMAGLVTGISREVMNLEIGIIEETLEYYDEVIRQRAERKEKWQIVRKDKKSLITSLGTVQYYKTLYRDKNTGECSYLLDSVSKETVKNKIHALDFSKLKEKVPEKKRMAKYLYIDADEDHASLQFNERRGDLLRNEQGRKNNCIQTKLIYVYEGIEKESPAGKRRQLVNPHYFCDVYGGRSNQDLWQEVHDYPDTVYPRFP